MKSQKILLFITFDKTDSFDIYLQLDKMTTEKYEYKAVPIDFSPWTGKLKADYLEIINEQGQQGWRFVTFASGTALPKGKKGVELVFERKL